jgi:hypothetical protein
MYERGNTFLHRGEVFAAYTSPILHKSLLQATSPCSLAFNSMGRSMTRPRVATVTSKKTL